MGDPSTLLIGELTGGKHNLILQGRALPYRSLSFAGSMRAEFTWYPGNPIASIQMLGPEEAPTTINGMWKDRFIKSVTDIGFPVLNRQGTAKYDGGVVRDVLELVRIADGFRRRGQLLEVAWDEITRHGILSNFKSTWLRREDVEWEMEFKWISQGEPIPPVAFGTDLSILDQFNEMLAAVNDLIDTVQAAFAVVSSVANAINNAITAIVEATQRIADLAKQATNLIMAPAEVVRSITAAYKTIKDRAQSVIDAVTSIPARLLRIADDISGLSADMNAEAEEYSRNVKKKARRVKSLAAQRQQEMEALTIKQPQVGIVTARADQDLRDLSQKYYGTPNEWKRIGQYNRVTGSRLSAGKMIVIPRLDAVTGRTVSAK